MKWEASAKHTKSSSLEKRNLVPKNEQVTYFDGFLFFSKQIWFEKNFGVEIGGTAPSVFRKCTSNSNLVNIKARSLGIVVNNFPANQNESMDNSIFAYSPSSTRQKHTEGSEPTKSNI